MKALISIILLLGLFYVGKAVWTKYDSIKKTQNEESGQASKPAPEPLAGLPATLEPSLQAAESQGPQALKNWLNRFASATRDPRLAEIQLDYVVMVSRQDPSEAKTVFAEVKRRVQPSSPVYARVKRLEKTYQ